jgi:uncharacterized Zn-binding protein involved in type VI secretion
MRIPKRSLARLSGKVYFGKFIMKDINGQDVARLGDKTDHGGVIIQAAPNLKHLGIPTALNGHLTECPRCNGTFPIIATGARTHQGIKVAMIGDKTACGATIVEA